MRPILYLFSACFALLSLIGIVNWLGIPNRLATPFVDHLLVAVSVTAASLLFGAAVIRRSPIERLSQLRKIGVRLRNSPVTSTTEFELWTERFRSWRKEIIDAANTTWTGVQRVALWVVAQSLNLVYAALAVVYLLLWFLVVELSEE